MHSDGYSGRHSEKKGFQDAVKKVSNANAVARMSTQRKTLRVEHGLSRRSTSRHLDPPSTRRNTRLDSPSNMRRERSDTNASRTSLVKGGLLTRGQRPTLSRGSSFSSTPSAARAEENAITVAVRVRPVNKRELELNPLICVEMPNGYQVNLAHCEGQMKYADNDASFIYDYAFWSVSPEHANFASQEKVYRTVGTDILTNGLGGFNSCLFCYGQTGSGKTFSMLGNETPEEQGLLPRIVRALFDHMEDSEQAETQFHCHVSYLQIYNETIQDLLVPAGEQQPLDVRNHPKHGSYIPGLTDNVVKTYADVKRLLKFGSMTRSVAATNMNNESSRSHCIFTIQMEFEEQIEGMRTETRSKLNLVDLAGAERQERAMTSGTRLKEGAAINQSLSALANVIHALADQCEGRGRNHDHIPFRNSKLTYFLKESLSGNSKTVMLAAIAPTKADFQETLSTLRFAKTCKDVKTHVHKNIETKGNVIKALNAEIERLREQLEQAHNDRVAEDLEGLEHLRDKHHQRADDMEKLDALRQKAMEGMGLSFDEETGAMKQDNTLPHLINISDDPYLEGALVFYLHPEVDIKVGSSEECDLVLTGLGIKPFMCSLYLKTKESDMVTLTRLTVIGEKLDWDGVSSVATGATASRNNLSEYILKKPRNSAVDDGALGRVLVNGKLAPDTCELHHRDRIIFGHSACFRLTLPSGKKDLQDVDGTESAGWLSALKEVVHDDNPDFLEFYALFDSIHDRLGKETAERFVNDFKAAWSMVEEANMITSDLRDANDVRFMLEVCFDAKTYREDYPELIVRMYNRNPDTDQFEVRDVFELHHFIEKLTSMKKLCFMGHVNSSRRTSLIEIPKPIDELLPELNFDPWSSFTHEKMRKLHDAVEDKVAELEAEVHYYRQLKAEVEWKDSQRQKLQEMRNGAQAQNQRAQSAGLKMSRPKKPYPIDGHACNKVAPRRGWNAAKCSFAR